jgi:hypothetical protein
LIPQIFAKSVTAFSFHTTALTVEERHPEQGERGGKVRARKRIGRQCLLVLAPSIHNH